jgi:SARP family transcriptional regulator, regulator of embCAB operon
MRYELLGPFRVIDDDEEFAVSARKLETVLASLVIRADDVVTPAQLATELWGDDPPRRAAAALHVYISESRKFLHRTHRSHSPIITHLSGYLLRKGPDEIDFHNFLQLMNEGRASARSGHYEEATARLELALAQWHGETVADLRYGPITKGFAAWMNESRIDCFELLADAQLRLGRHREVVGRLYSLTAEYPLRETFYRQLMLALYRSERQADALDVYRTARATLQDALGLEPCQPLRNLQRAILTDDRMLEFTAI